MANKDQVIKTITKILSNKNMRISKIIIPDDVLNDAPESVSEEAGWNYEIVIRKEETGLVKFTKGMVWTVLVWIAFTGSGIEDKCQGYTQPLINTTRIKLCEFIKNPPLNFPDSKSPFDPTYLPIYNSYLTSGATGISGDYFYNPGV
jgi:hypothetical protein